MKLIAGCSYLPQQLQYFIKLLIHNSNQFSKPPVGSKSLICPIYYIFLSKKLKTKDIHINLRCTLCFGVTNVNAKMVNMVNIISAEHQHVSMLTSFNSKHCCA